ACAGLTVRVVGGGCLRVGEPPGLIVLAWPELIPPELVGESDGVEATLLQLLAQLIGNGVTSDLHRRLVAAETREVVTGATSVDAWVSAEPGRALFLSLNNTSPGLSARAELPGELEEVLRATLAELAGHAAGAEGLRLFNVRVSSALEEMRHSMDKFLCSPPRFGVRGVHDQWLEHLQESHRMSGSRGTLGCKPCEGVVDIGCNKQIAAVQALLDSGRNFWAEYIARWGLLKRSPLTVMAEASAAHLEELRAQQEARMQRFTSQVVGWESRRRVAPSVVESPDGQREYSAPAPVLDAESMQYPTFHAVAGANTDEGVPPPPPPSAPPPPLHTVGLVGTNRGSFRLSRTKCLCCVAPKAVGVGSQANAADELGEELPSARDCQLWEDLCSGRLEVVRNATSTAQKAEEEAAALRAFSAEYEKRTQAIEAAERETPSCRLVEDPPLTADPTLDYVVRELPGGAGGSLVIGRFEGSHKSVVHMGFALAVEDVPSHLLLYLSALPVVLKHVGVVEYLDVRLSCGHSSGRVELLWRCANTSSSAPETALGWLEAMATQPFLLEHCPRGGGKGCRVDLELARDAVSAAAAEARALTDQRPEFWADSVFWAVRHEGSAAFQAASCHLTRAHCLARVAWLLRPPPSLAEAATVRMVLQALSATAAGFACAPPTMPAGGAGSKGNTGGGADQPLSPEAGSSGKVLCAALASALQSLIAALAPDAAERVQAPTANADASAEWRLRLPGTCNVEELLQSCSPSAGDVLRDVMRHLHCHVAALGGGEGQVRRDWEALCSTLGEDLFTPVEHTARNLEDALSWCRRPHCARAFLSCTPQQEEMAAAALTSTISGLGPLQAPRPDPQPGRLGRAQGGAGGLVLRRWQQRMRRGLDGGGISELAALWRSVVPAPLPSPR
ncbi:hypothetical protein CYMTET_31621, partial [Cymbomonas tetramitiformis]